MTRLGGCGPSLQQPASWQQLHMSSTQISLCTCRHGRLLKFALGPGSLQWQGGQPCGAQLTFLGAANQRKGRADTYSKVPAVAWSVPFALHQLLQRQACHRKV